MTTFLFPDKPTAILVIHGIGEQKPFETLDSFAVNLAKYLKKSGAVFTLQHQLAERRVGNSSPWSESYVRFSPTDKGNPIDVHEFYWAYITEEKISVPEVWAWVKKTLDGTKRFYRENSDLQKRYEERRGTSRFPLAKIAFALRVASIFAPIVHLLKIIFSPIVPVIPGWVQSIGQSLLDKTRWIIVGYLGDVAIYTSMDEKSRNFRLRQRIIQESQGLLESILDDDAYERVIVAGHSLGSVIAYDTLNRINIAANLESGKTIPLEKIAGLITFGSPLDKIAFFFREHTREAESVRRQIIQHLHSFKSKQLDTLPNDFLLSDPIEDKLAGVPWMNCFSTKDPVSGHLDFYVIPEEDNVQINLKESWGVAHVGYWTNESFYANIVRRFISS